MRANAKIAVLIIFCLIGVGAFGAYESLARIGATSECGGCHTTSGVLTLTSNATGTVNAIQGQQFWLLVDAAGYTGGDNLFVISMQPDWADNNEFSVVPTEIQDGSPVDLDTDTNEIQALLSFTPTSTGSYTIRIWTAAAGGLATVLDVSVDVIFVDMEPPTIDSPADREISLGDLGATITWTPEDATPNRYEVTNDSILFDSGGWDGSPITVSLATIPMGVHDITITVWDMDERSVSDTVIVTVVDDAPPSINGPGDMEVDLGTTGNEITWDPSDPSPDSYEIFKDEISLKTGVWNASLETITVNIDGLSIGEYNYTLLVTDLDGMTATDTVIVTVDDFTRPTLNSPSDITYELGDTGYSFVWTLMDAYPISYTVYLDGIVNRTGPWNTTGETITMDVDGLPVEYYNYTILITDLGGNTATDTVFVRVNHPNLPTLDHPPDQYLAEFATGNTIIWHPHDNQAGNKDYTVYKDGVSVKTGKWPGSNNIWINIDGLGLGSYNYTCEISDANNNYAYDTVWVFVYDGTNPLISNPPDVIYDEGDPAAYIVSWNGTDAHPVSYEIFLDDVSVKSGDWNSSTEFILFDAGGLPYGDHTITLELVDIGNNEATDSVLVSVLDGTDPIISNQVDVQIDEGSTGNILSWNGTDLHPATYTIYLDNVLLCTGWWNSSAEFVTVDISGLEYGIYNYTTVLTDIGDVSAADQAIVTVIDNTPPQVDSPSDVSFVQGETGNKINWTCTDLHPVSYEVYIDGELSKSDVWSASPQTVSISVDNLGEGVHIITITLYDIDGNSVSDSVTVTVIDGIAPFVSSPDDIEYTAGRVGNYFIWSVSDPNPGDYTIYLDNTILRTGSLNDTFESVTVFVDGLAPGTHNYTLLARDSLGNSGSDSVIVTVNPSTTSTTTTTTGSTNTTETTDDPTDVPLSGSMEGIVIALTYASCIAGALIVTELYRRKYR